MTNEIKPEIRALADQLKANLTYDHRGAVDGVVKATFKEETFANTLPEGLTIGQVSAVHNHHAAVLAAGQIANGETAIEAMAKHKSVEAFESELPMVGRDSYTFRTLRSAEGRNPRDGSTTTSYARTSGGLDIYAAGNRGEVKKGRLHLSELGEKALAPKK